MIRRSSYYLRNHKPVQVLERQCCSDNCRKFFIEASSTFECSSCGLLEWCSEGCAKRDAHNSEGTAKSYSGGRPHEAVTRARRARCVVCCMSCPEPVDDDYRHESYKTTHFWKDCGYVPLCKQPRGFDGEKMPCWDFWHDPRVDSVRNGDLHGFPCSNFPPSDFVGVFRPSGGHVSPAKIFTSTLVARASTLIKQQRFPKKLDPQYLSRTKPGPLAKRSRRTKREVTLQAAKASKARLLVNPVHEGAKPEHWVSAKNLPGLQTQQPAGNSKQRSVRIDVHNFKSSPLTQRFSLRFVEDDMFKAEYEGENSFTEWFKICQ